MRRLIALLTCVVVISAAGCASVSHPQSQSHAKKRAKETAAMATARGWLEMLDVGDYERAFGQKSPRYRASSTQPQFAHAMQGRRAPFGRVKARKFIGARRMTRLVGLPDGDYEAILFKTDFQNKSAAAERVILAREGGRLHVTGYRIY